MQEGRRLEASRRTRLWYGVLSAFVRHFPGVVGALICYRHVIYTYIYIIYTRHHAQASASMCEDRGDDAAGQDQRLERRADKSPATDNNAPPLPHPQLHPHPRQCLPSTPSPLTRSRPVNDWYASSLREAAAFYKKGIHMMFQEGVVDLTRARGVL